MFLPGDAVAAPVLLIAKTQDFFNASGGWSSVRNGGSGAAPALGAPGRGARMGRGDLR